MRPARRQIATYCLPQMLLCIDEWEAAAESVKRGEYAGTYVEQDLGGAGSHPRVIEITFSDQGLVAELKGRGHTQLSTQSDTNFSNFFGFGIRLVMHGQE